VGAPPLLPAQPAAAVPPRRGHREACLCAHHRPRRTNYVDLIPSLCARRRSDPFSVCNVMRRNACGSPVMFMDVDASKEKEDGMARVVDHVRGLYVRARVDDARRSKGMEAV
jgi:hypothetical protein